MPDPAEGLPRTIEDVVAANPEFARALAGTAGQPPFQVVPDQPARAFPDGAPLPAEDPPLPDPNRVFIVSHDTSLTNPDRVRQAVDSATTDVVVGNIPGLGEITQRYAPTVVEAGQDQIGNNATFALGDQARGTDVPVGADQYNIDTSQTRRQTLNPMSTVWTNPDQTQTDAVVFNSSNATPEQLDQIAQVLSSGGVTQGHGAIITQSGSGPGGISSITTAASGVGVLHAAGLISNPTLLRLGRTGQNLPTGEPVTPRPALGPGHRLTESATTSISSRAGPALLNEMRLANQRLVELQQKALTGQINLNQLQSDGFRQLSDLREAQAQQLALNGQRDSDELRQRLSEVDQAIEGLQSSRVDPEAFLGHDGVRRIGFGVAVAIGQLASNFGGGPNTALQTLETRIQQNIRAQEANLANRRAGVAAQSNALGMFRSILGDERAARAALEQSLWSTATMRLNSMVAHARNPIISANGQALIAAAHARAIGAAVDAANNAWRIQLGAQSTRRSTQTAQDVAGNAVLGNELANAQRNAAYNQRNAPQQPAGAPQAQPAPSPQAAPRTPTAPRRGPATGHRRPRPRVAPPQEQPTLLGFNRVDAPNITAGTRLAERAGTQPGNHPIPSGVFSTIRGDTPQSATDRFNSLPPEEQADITETARNANAMAGALRRLIEIARTHNPEVLYSMTTGESRNLVFQVQAALRQAAHLGAPSAQELEMVADLVNDPTGVNARRFAGQASATNLEGSLSAVLALANRQLAVRNFAVDTLHERVAHGRGR